MPLLLAARKPCGWALGHSWTLGLSLSPSEISGGAFFFLAVSGRRCSTSVAWHVGSSSLTRDQTQAPCNVSAESQPLDHGEVPFLKFLF